MREVVIETETTGLDPHAGHRIIEIACLELVHRFPTGRSFHRYVNPERDMPADALAIHGLSAEFLAGHPPFSSIVDELMAFIGGDRLVIHGAEFDRAFVNAELARLGRGPLVNSLVDTLVLARRRFPGSPISRTALCRRFAIDVPNRNEHTTRVYCDLVAKIYAELI